MRSTRVHDGDRFPAGPAPTSPWMPALPGLARRLGRVPSILGRPVRVSRLVAVMAVTGVAALVAASASHATSITNSVSSITTDMTKSSGNFSAFTATPSACSSSTLAGGGALLTNSGLSSPYYPVTNDGSAILGVYPSASGAPWSSGSYPSEWTTTAGYAHPMGTVDDTLTSYALCISGITASTYVVSSTASSSLGPLTETCDTNDDVIGGGGGYTGYNGSNNTKIISNYPSDSSGALPSNGGEDPTSWTVVGNSNSDSGATLYAYALCATGSVPTDVNSSSTTLSSPSAGEATSPVSVACSSGSVDTLLSGGSVITFGSGSGGQGVHLVGDFPSDSSDDPVSSGSASTWTVIAENGGGSVASITAKTVALCYDGDA
jgi:hypothetical protein